MEQVIIRERQTNEINHDEEKEKLLTSSNNNLSVIPKNIRESVFVEIPLEKKEHEITMLLVGSKTDFSFSENKSIDKAVNSNGLDKIIFAQRNCSGEESVFEQNREANKFKWVIDQTESKLLANKLSGRDSLWDRTGIGPLLTVLINNCNSGKYRYWQQKSLINVLL